MTSMNVSMQQYVVAEHTAAATTPQGRMNATVSDLTSLKTTAVSKVTYIFIFRKKCKPINHLLNNLHFIDL